jgi:hypothetical protein
MAERTQEKRKRIPISEAAKPWKRRLATPEAAAYTGVTVSTMRAWRLKGPDDPNPGPKFIRLSGSLVVYDIDELDAYLAKKRAATYSVVTPHAA